MSDIMLKNIKKQYGDIEVLRNINLQINSGEFVVLVGPSGCGKSTLLRAIAGLETISSGDIEINNKVMNKIAPKDRDISMVFQSYALYPHLNVARNMGFSLEVRKRPKEEVDRAVKNAAEILDLTHLLDRKPKELSGGQRQRVAMGRAIVRSSKVFLFDEPLSNLDAQLRGHMRIEIKKLHQRLNNTIVYVTHDQVEAMTLADKIVVLNHGLVQQVGSPLELYDTPTNKFVAGFMGSPQMNFFTGQIKGQDKNVMVDIGDNVLLPISNKERLQAQSKVEYGIRPENIIICNASSSDAIAMKVSLIEPTGLSELIHGSIGKHPLTVYSTMRSGAKSGDIIYIRFELEKASLFDANTLNRIN